MQSPFVSGRAFFPGSSRMVLARLVQNAAGGLTLAEEGGGVIASAYIDDVQIESRLGSAPRRITFPDGALFETDDHHGLATITGKTPNSGLHRWEGFHPRLVAVIAVCLAGAWFLWRFGLDVLVAAAIWLTPQPIVTAIDTGTLYAMDKTIAAPSQLSYDDKKRALAIFSQLVEQMGDDARKQANFTLNFRQVDGMGPNAFALPGGTVVMTDALVSMFPSADVQAGVLGHELGHVVEQHGLRQMYRSAGIYLLIAVLAGDTGPILEDLLLEGNLILSLAYSRQHEASADAYGVALSRNAGFDPTGLATFFEYLDETMGDSGPAWMSTHPSSAERVQKLKQLSNAP